MRCLGVWLAFKLRDTPTNATFVVLLWSCFLSDRLLLTPNQWPMWCDVMWCGWMRAVDAMCPHNFDHLVHFTFFYFTSVVSWDWGYYIFLSLQKLAPQFTDVKNVTIQNTVEKAHTTLCMTYSSLLTATENISPQEETEKVYCPYTVPHHTAVWLIHPSLPSLVYSC